MITQLLAHFRPRLKIKFGENMDTHSQTLAPQFRQNEFYLRAAQRATQTLEFDAVVCDLDGTIMPSYKTLLAVHEVRAALVETGCAQEDAEKFVTDYLGGKRPVEGKAIEFQSLLHIERTAHRALKQFGRDYSYKKPNNTPMHEIMSFGIIPETILFIGEGKNDLLSVYADRANPAAVFAFQEQGAKTICDRQRETNEAIRPGTERLGIAPVNDAIAKLGVESEIIRLPDGFQTLIELWKANKIHFTRPHAMPVVRNNSLSAWRTPGRAVVAAEPIGLLYG